MINVVKESLWKQFGASIDMFKNAVRLWPEEHWNADKKFFYMAYHCTVFLDYYTTVSPKNFAAALPFTFAEPARIPEDAIDDLVPDRVYTKEELLGYLDTARENCRLRIANLTQESLAERWVEDFEGGMNYSALEILLYNMRHVQHHAAQLNFILRQRINNAPRWVARAGDEV